MSQETLLAKFVELLNNLRVLVFFLSMVIESLSCLMKFLTQVQGSKTVLSALLLVAVWLIANGQVSKLDWHIKHTRLIIFILPAMGRKRVAEYWSLHKAI